MGLLTTLHSGRMAHDAFDDEPGLWTSSWQAPASWLQGFVDTGIAMTPELAMTVSAVWAGVTFMARNVGSLPLRLYRRLDDGRSKERADDVPLARVIGRQPNKEHTAIEYWEMQIGHILLRGNAYSRIIEGSRSFADQLVPIHPDIVTPERLPNGNIIYRIQPIDGRPPEFLTPDEMFHLRGFMSDGLSGLSLTAVAARSLGAAVAADTFAARFFKAGASASVVAQVDRELDDTSEEDLHRSISRYMSGLRNVGGVLVVDQNTTVNKLGINPQEAQLISTREHGVREVARWLGLPTQVLADAGKEPTHASAEIFAADLVKYSFRPFGVRIEQAVDRDLALDDNLFAEYFFDSILRGDMKARSAFYQLAVFTGWMNRQEVRESENMNPGPPELDDFLQPTNMANAGFEPASSGRTAPVEARPADRVEGMRSGVGVRATMVALSLANRIVRRELAKVERAARQHASDGQAWKTWLKEFYESHAEYVSTELHVPLSQAREYAAQQGMALEENGISVTEDWRETLPPKLAEMALEGDYA